MLASATTVACAGVCAAIVAAALCFGLLVTLLAGLSIIVAIAGGTAGIAIFCCCASAAFAAGCVAACALAGTVWLLVTRRVTRSMLSLLPSMQPYAEPAACLVFGQGILSEGSSAQADGTSSSASASSKDQQGTIPPLQIDATQRSTCAPVAADGLPHPHAPDAAGLPEACSQGPGTAHTQQQSAHGANGGVARRPFVKDGSAQADLKGSKLGATHGKQRPSKLRRGLFRCEPSSVLHGSKACVRYKCMSYELPCCVPSNLRVCASCAACVSMVAALIQVMTERSACMPGAMHGSLPLIEYHAASDLLGAAAQAGQS